VSEPELQEDQEADFEGRKLHTLTDYKGIPLEDWEYLEPHLPDVPREAETAGHRVTVPYLTKYEKARVVGTRAMQISRSAPPQIMPGPDDDSALKIAYKEFEAGLTPFIIRRFLPDGNFEDWTLQELKH